MGYFEGELEQKKAEGFEYLFGESVAPVLERWSKLLIGMQSEIEFLKEENKKLWNALSKKQDFDVRRMSFNI